MIPGLRPALFSGGGSSPFTIFNAVTADGGQGSISGDTFTATSNGVLFSALPVVGPLRTAGKWQFELEFAISAPHTFIGGGVYVPAEGALPDRTTISYADGTVATLGGSGAGGFFPPVNPVNGGRMAILMDLDSTTPVFRASGTGTFTNAQNIQRRAAGHAPCAWINTNTAPVGWQGSVRFIGRRADMRFSLATNYQPWDDT